MANGRPSSGSKRGNYSRQLMNLSVFVASSWVGAPMATGTSRSAVENRKGKTVIQDTIGGGLIRLVDVDFKSLAL